MRCFPQIYVVCEKGYFPGRVYWNTVIIELRVPYLGKVCLAMGFWCGHVHNQAGHQALPACVWGFCVRII